MSNEWLEKLARSLAGETLSSGAAGNANALNQFIKSIKP